MPDAIEYREDGRVAEIVLDRPSVLNAISAEMGIELLDTFKKIEQSHDVDIVRVSGKGDSFSSGFDLNELRDDMGGMSYGNYRRHAEGKEAIQTLSRRMDKSDVITVSAVHGNALGAGLELAIVSDIAIATQSATLVFPETEIGLSITNGVTNLLPRAIGLQRAKLLVLTGERISGREAAEMGLIAEAVPEENLSGKVDEVINMILEKTLSGVQSAKYLLNVGRENRYEESLERELNEGLSLLRSEEYQTALQEFFG